MVTSGSPRLFNPAAAAWYDSYVGAGNYLRLVNNRDIVPSMPLKNTPCVTTELLPKPSSRGLYQYHESM